MLKLASNHEYLNIIIRVTVDSNQQKWYLRCGGDPDSVYNRF